MEKFNQSIDLVADIVTGTLSTQSKRLIAFLLTVITLFYGLFANFAKLSGLLQLALDEIIGYIPKSSAKHFTSGKFSLVDLMTIHFDLDQGSSAIILIVVAIAFVACAGFGVYGILTAKSKSTLPLAITSLVYLIISIVYIIVLNSKFNDLFSGFSGMLGMGSSSVSALSFNFAGIFTVIFGCFAHLFWVSAYSEMNAKGEIANIGSIQDEFMSLFNKAKSDVSNSAKIAKVKAQQAKEDNSCKSCGKLMSPSAKFCGGCGQSRS